MDSSADEGDYLAVHLAAQLAGVSERTLRPGIKRGKVPSIAGNRGALVRLADVRGVADLAGMSRQWCRVVKMAPTLLRMADKRRLWRPCGRTRRRASRAVIEAAYDGQLAAKDNLIAELRQRAEGAEERAAQLERAVRRQQRPWWLRGKRQVSGQTRAAADGGCEKGNVRAQDTHVA